jgi:hypothetical protein
MNFSIERNEAKGKIKFYGEIDYADLARLRLDGMDRALLNDVDSDPEASAADYLLALEVIFRRHAQQLMPDDGLTRVPQAS